MRWVEKKIKKCILFSYLVMKEKKKEMVLSTSNFSLWDTNFKKDKLNFFFNLLIYFLPFARV